MSDSTQRNGKTASSTRRVFVVSLVLALVLVAVIVLALHVASNAGRSSAQAQQDESVMAVATAIAAERPGGGFGTVTGALANMDVQPAQSWVLSSAKTLLFVREGEGLTADLGAPVEDYAPLAGAAGLYDALPEGSAAHASTFADGVEYLVSATQFTYDGIGYELALVSDVGGLQLPANPIAPLLGLPRQVLACALAVLLALLVAIPTWVAYRREKAARKLAQPRVCVPRPAGEMRAYLEALLNDGSTEASLARVDFEDDAQQASALGLLGNLGEDVLLECFESEGCSVILVIAEPAERDVREAVAPCLASGGQISVIIPAK